MTGSGSSTGFLPSGFTTFLVYLTSVAHVRGVSLCSLERQDSPLLQGLIVAEDPLSVTLISTLSSTSNRNPGSGTNSHGIPE